jgi:hypothetical protein
MWTKIIEFIVKRVLWPLLKTIIELVLVQASQWLLEKIRATLRKWRQEEEATASSEAEREAIHKKYVRRETDLETIEREVPEKMREIVRGAMHEADKQAQILIEDSAKPSKPKQKPKSKKPRAKKKT